MGLGDTKLHSHPALCLGSMGSSLLLDHVLACTPQQVRLTHRDPLGPSSPWHRSTGPMAGRQFSGGGRLGLCHLSESL